MIDLFSLVKLACFRESFLVVVIRAHVNKGLSAWLIFTWSFVLVDLYLAQTRGSSIIFGAISGSPESPKFRLRVSRISRLSKLGDVFYLPNLFEALAYLYQNGFNTFGF